MIPKLFSVNFGGSSVVHDGPSLDRSSGRPLSRCSNSSENTVGVGFGRRCASPSTTPSLPAVFLELSNEFQRARGITQSNASTFHCDGIAHRVVELTHREILEAARVLGSQPTGFDGSQPPHTSTVGDLTCEDIAALGRMLADTISDIVHGGVGGASGGDVTQLRCGNCGVLRIRRSTKSISFAPALPSAHAGPIVSSLRRRGSSTNAAPRDDDNEGMWMLSMTAVPALRTRAATPPPVAAKPPVVEQSIDGGSGGGGGGGDTNECLLPPPELRRYISGSSQGRAASRQQGQSVRPSSQCSSLGPSASEAGVGGGRVRERGGFLTQQDLSSQPHRTQPTDCPLNSPMWRSKHRRDVLDEELADIQQALEARLGISSPFALPTRTNTTPPPLRTHSPSLLFDASTGSSHRSATALAYYSAAPGEHRHPSKDRRELTMHQAVLRHANDVKRKELEEARLDAIRGARDEQAILARIETEVLRRSTSEKLTAALLNQKRLDATRRDGRGRLVGDVETSIMRPIDTTPFSSPPPASPLRCPSVAALGSDPTSIIAEKRSAIEKRQAYHRELDAQNASLAASRQVQRQLRRQSEEQHLAANQAAMQRAKEAHAQQKSSFRLHYVEAWDMQRKIRRVPSSFSSSSLSYSANDDAENDASLL